MRINLKSALVITSALLIFSACGRGAPAIKIDGDKYKFGEVLEGKDVVYAFVFKNTGNKDLVIDDLFVSCFCVTIKSYDKLTKPGEKGKIYGVIKTEGFEGEISKSIKMKTNIPNVEPVLTIEGKIIPRPK